MTRRSRTHTRSPARARNAAVTRPLWPPPMTTPSYAWVAPVPVMRSGHDRVVFVHRSEQLSSGEALEGQGRDVQARRPVEDHLGDQAAGHRGLLEAVPREPVAEEQPLDAGRLPHDRVEIGRSLEH